MSGNSVALGQRLRRERQRIGLNQTDFARLGGVSRNSQTEYETGKTPPNSDYLCKIADEGVDIAYVLLGTIAGELLTAGESELLLLVRQLGPDWLDILLSTARQAADNLAIPPATIHAPKRGYRPKA